MASTYELYLGGPRQQNTDWAIFPAAPFSAANVSNLAPPSKAPIAFGVSRTLDFTNDKALNYFYKKNMANTPVINDAFGLLVIPSNSAMLGVWYKVNSLCAGAVGQFSLRTRVAGKVMASGLLLSTTASSGFVPADPTGVITTADTIGVTFPKLFTLFKTPDIIDMLITTLPSPNSLLGFSLTVTAVYLNMQSGMMN